MPLLTSEEPEPMSFYWPPGLATTKTQTNLMLFAVLQQNCAKLSFREKGTYQNHAILAMEIMVSNLRENV